MKYPFCCSERVEGSTAELKLRPLRTASHRSRKAGGKTSYD